MKRSFHQLSLAHWNKTSFPQSFCCNEIGMQHVNKRIFRVISHRCLIVNRADLISFGNELELNYFENGRT